MGLTSPTNSYAINSLSQQQYYYLDYQGNLPTLLRFNQDTTDGSSLVAQSPATWPQVQISMQRFIKTNRFVNVCRVICTSPITGQVMQLVWDGIGSSLRGARLQRNQIGSGGTTTSGWATWDDDPSTVASNTATLDDP